MKRVISIILFVSLLVGMFGMNTVFAASKVVFKDVTSNHWASSAISEMANQGLFEGKSKNEDGLANFCPDDIMTRAEFITVIVRAFYSKDLENYEVVRTPWWRIYYSVVLDRRILEYADLDRGDLDKPMTREEMAMVIAKTLENQGEYYDKLIPTNRIADFSEVNSKYQEYVQKAYTKGILTGVDSNGTFDPDGTLTRAQAATVLYRMINPSARVSVKF